MIDIYSKGTYPACALSNFAVHPFVLDGVAVKSMEGFLQSLKYLSQKTQKKVCMLSGNEAKRAGRKYLWRITKTVYWNGRKYHLYSDDLQVLMDRAFQALFEQNPSFKKALYDTGSEILTHSIGKKRIDRTIMTEYQFVQHLYRLRHQLLSELCEAGMTNYNGKETFLNDYP